MKHQEIFREIPRIIRELHIAEPAHRQDPRFVREITLQDGAMDMVYRLCCDEALTALSLELGKPQKEIYAAITKVFKMSLDDLEKLMPPPEEIMNEDQSDSEHAAKAALYEKLADEHFLKDPGAKTPAAFIVALNIFAMHCKDGDMKKYFLHAEHDVITIEMDLDNLTPDTPRGIRLMRLGFSYNLDEDCWEYFT